MIKKISILILLIFVYTFYTPSFIFAQIQDQTSSQSQNYKITSSSFGFGSGVTSSSTYLGFDFLGIGLNSNDSSSTNYNLNNNFTSKVSTNVPYYVTLQNPSSKLYYNKLNLVINNTSNTQSDKEFAVQILKFTDYSSNQTITTSGNSIVGTNTTFTTSLSANDIIFCSGQYHLIKSITDNTHATLYSNDIFIPAITSGTNFSSISGNPSNWQYVKSDNSVGSTLSNSSDWRSYSSWGSSSGITITGLLPNTKYAVRSKVRQKGTNYTPGTESGWSPVIVQGGSLSVATTSSPFITFNINGVTGSGGTDRTTVTSSPGAVSFGSVAAGAPVTASHNLVVSTNALSGYNIQVIADQKLKSSTNTIDWAPGTSASPLIWSSPTGTANNNSGYFGYTSDDTSIFASGKYSGFSTSSYYDVVNYTSDAPLGNTNKISYKVEVNYAQPAGNYSGTSLTFAVTGKF